MSDWPETYRLGCPYPMCDATIRVVAAEGQGVKGRCICHGCVVRVVWPDEANARHDGLTFTEPVLELAQEADDDR